MAVCLPSRKHTRDLADLAAKVGRLVFISAETDNWGSAEVHEHWLLLAGAMIRFKLRLRCPQPPYGQSPTPYGSMSPESAT
jgi:hypothetical protein